MPSSAHSSTEHAKRPLELARQATSHLRQWIRRRAESAGVAADDRVIDRLAAYVELLQRWNAKLNLTRLIGDDEGLDRLVIEPLAAVPYVPDRGALVDIGSGSGSPAIPMALAAPGLRLRMVEVKLRKAAFLREAVRHLEIGGSEVVAERYERVLARRDLRYAHDALTVRGVRIDTPALRRLGELVSPGGTLLLFRGAEPEKAGVDVAPVLTLEATIPLPGSSRLVVLRRRSEGRASPSSG